MTVGRDSGVRHSHGGKVFAFCCEGCLAKFKADPRRYAGPDETAASAAERGAEPSGAGKVAGGYTCPMHPEVRQPGPGSCPKCGMALEPVTPVAAAPRNEWVCPMHPEIVRDAPGDCPICGMALEPRTAAADEEE
ncbi:MAG: heavy metal-binding domain-containing protein, partial [Actinomycetota bacterium]